jgi:hypothetical protein
MSRQVDTATLQMALIGCQAQLVQLNEKMQEIQRRLGGRPAATDGRGDVPGPFLRKRHMSAAGRRRIAAAQRKRWAAFHKGARAKKGAVKRTLSPEAKSKLAANLTKARAARAAKANSASV